MNLSLILTTLIVLFISIHSTKAACGTLKDGNIITISPNLAVSICSESIVRIVKVPTSNSTTYENATMQTMTRTSLMVDPNFPSAKESQKFTMFEEEEDIILIKTKNLLLKANKKTNLIQFYDIANEEKVITSEVSYKFEPTVDYFGDKNQSTFGLQQEWSLDNSEGMYGGGEYQNGIMDYSATPIELVQFNTEAVVPFFISTKGYGILWDNNGRSVFNPPKEDWLLSGMNGGNLTKEIEFTPTVDGDYIFYVNACSDYGCGMNHYLNLSIVAVGEKDGREQIIQYWDDLTNLPDSISGRATGLRSRTKYTISMQSSIENVKLYYIPPQASSKSALLKSRLGDLIDYYFVYKSEEKGVDRKNINQNSHYNRMDNAISGYRQITGSAPLYASWAYGFWQCKEHYHNQTELLNAAAKFRALKIPVDAFVQDWHYWGNLGWGPQWDHTIYPDPKGMVEALHDENIHFMISVWSKFDNFTSFYKEMFANGHILKGSIYYDPWSADAREMFYQFSKKAHFDIDVDALWLDATEPEGFSMENQSIALGSGNAYFNSYSLMTTKAIADGLRRDFSNEQGRRVFSLTRSSFAGQQRTGAALWSGDISGKWDSMRRQISASLNYQMSGHAYWSEDIGGFFRPKNQYTDPGYHTLLIRWFQFGCFTPIFRVHGGGSNTELWNYGQDVQNTIVNTAIRIRYRLLSYIYSGFFEVLNFDYTMQRAMALEFPDDEKVYQINDQFVFGHSIIVAPIYTESQSREVYLPNNEGNKYFNFFSGQEYESGTTVTVTNLPINEMALFIRAGTILPLGPDLQHVTEKQQDPIEFRIYQGANGQFTLYEDDGETASTYVKNQYTRIDFNWDDISSTLTIGKRNGGGFKGMILKRTFNFIIVKVGHGTGLDIEMKADKTINYNGDGVTVKF